MRFVLALFCLLFAAGCDLGYPFYDSVEGYSKDIQKFRLWDENHPTSCEVRVYLRGKVPSQGTQKMRILGQDCARLGIYVIRVQVGPHFYVLDYVGIPGHGKKCFSATPVAPGWGGRLRVGRRSDPRCINPTEEFNPQPWPGDHEAPAENPPVYEVSVLPGELPNPH